MVQYGFCGGAAKPANTFYLFWQWAWPKGCRILHMWAPRRGREDTASAAGHRADGPRGSRDGCWSCPCLQPLQPPCLHQHLLPIPAPRGAGWCLAPCKEGGQSMLSSPCSRAGFGVTQHLLLPFQLPQAMGHYPQLLRQSTSPPRGVPASQFLLSHPSMGLDSGSNPLSAQYSSPKSEYCRAGARLGEGPVPEKWEGEGDSHLVTWKQADNGHSAPVGEGG